MSRVDAQAEENLSEAQALSKAEVYEDIIQELSSTPTPGSSQLLVLQAHLRSVLKYGHLHGGAIFHNIVKAAESGTTNVIRPTAENNTPWVSCKKSARLIGLLACPDDRLVETFWFPDSVMDDLQKEAPEPTTSLRAAYVAAKANAQSADGITTVLVVSLVDLCDLENFDTDDEAEHTSFSHTFAVGIGPEGFVIWQSWSGGDWYYSLEDHLKRDGARVRSWSEGDTFVHKFDELAQHKGTWDEERNEVYWELFNVDIVRLCGEDGPLLPVVPKFAAWVKLQIIEDVQIQHLQKSNFIDAESKEE